jgi:hypothetical protein
MEILDRRDPLHLKLCKSPPRLPRPMVPMQERPEAERPDLTLPVPASGRCPPGSHQEKRGSPPHTAIQYAYDTLIVTYASLSSIT